MRRWVDVAGAVWAVVLAGRIAAAASDAAATAASRPPPPGTGPSDEFARLNLPEAFVQRIREREAIDSHQSAAHAAAASVKPTPQTEFIARNRVGEFVRVIRGEPATTIRAYRAANAAKVPPLRGFRAPILENAAACWPTSPATNQLCDWQREAAVIIEGRLAHDGLMPTLARLMFRLDPQEALKNPELVLTELGSLGFPTDLLQHFQTTGTELSKRSESIVRLIAQRQLQGASLETVLNESQAIRFDFVASTARVGLPDASSPGPPSEPAEDSATGPRGRFEVATESGEDEVGMFRMQVGGGWREGVVPGGSIDVIAQLVEAQRNADFLVSVANEVAEPFRSMAAGSWRLRRRHQVVLCVADTEVAAWAQDNGKAGMILGPDGRRRLATLAPRYACLDEGRSTYEPGESYLMDGLQAGGHVVVHSPLLFQGGNLLAVRDPKTGERILLLGEGEVHRNVALGLTRAQVVEAFGRELSVARCVVVPAVSYHLDYDVCVRSQPDGLTAFVNDNRAASRNILRLGLSALERQGALDTETVRNANEHLTARRDLELLQCLGNKVERLAQVPDGYPASVSRAFATTPLDDAAGNLQTFLLALDLVKSEVAQERAPGPDRAESSYLMALRRTEAARQNQAEGLRNLGWKVVAVPSMSELYRGINYLNGIHQRGSYLMPTFGGFYEPLDQAASAAFREALGPGVRIVGIRSAECQRHYGGVHCAAAAYPRLETGATTRGAQAGGGPAATIHASP